MMRRTSGKELVDEQDVTDAVSTSSTCTPPLSISFAACVWLVCWRFNWALVVAKCARWCVGAALFIFVQDGPEMPRKDVPLTRD